MEGITMKATRGFTVLAMTCKSCKHNKDRKCSILEKYLLMMARVESDREYSNISNIKKSLLLTDKAIEEFKCNYYENKKGEK